MVYSTADFPTGSYIFPSAPLPTPHYVSYYYRTLSKEPSPRFHGGA